MEKISLWAKFANQPTIFKDFTDDATAKAWWEEMEDEGYHLGFVRG